MRYTGPKFKLCRREQVNLFGSDKYDVKNRRSLPWQHGSSMKRNSEYGKLLRNKQILKRSYMLSEKQFAKLVQKTSAKYSKNNNMSHDAALYMFLEDRMDSIIYRAWFAKTIIQARQMISHGHFLLNGKKHNIPSTFIKVGDKITLKPKMKESPLYAGATVSKTFKVPSWIKVDRNKYEIELLTMPVLWELWVLADILKVIEFYARA